MAEIFADNKTEKEEIAVSNEALKKELWERGFYVDEISRGDGIEYLVVSTAPPLRQITDRNAK